MADFHQTGIITTLHRLGSPGLERLENELETHSRKRPVALVLPALYAEFEGQAMPKIVAELAKVRYLEPDRRRAGPGLGVPVPHGGGFSQAARRHGPHPAHREQADSGGAEHAEAQRGQPRGGRQGPGHLAGLRVCHRLRQGRHHRAARLRHTLLQPGTARAALLSGGAPGPGLRLLQGLLQPGHRQAARSGDPPAHHAAGALAHQARRGEPVSGLPRQLQVPARRRVLHDDRRGPGQPHPLGLGARGRRARRGPAQLLAAADLPGRHRRELRAQAPGPLRRRPRQRG